MGEAGQVLSDFPLEDWSALPLEQQDRYYDRAKETLA